MEADDLGLKQNPMNFLSDKTVFSINFVPLQLKADDNLIWVNKTPSSIRYCRPIRFKFAKEEKYFVKNQYKYYSDLLEKVKTYEFKIDEFNFTVSFDMQCTMIDGKICNYLTDQDSTRSCNICRVNPGKINDLKYVRSLKCQILL